MVLAVPEQKGGIASQVVVGVRLRTPLVWLIAVGIVFIELSVLLSNYAAACPAKS